MPKNINFDKEEVLNTLRPVFIQNGYNGTSMQEIVDATGLNRSSIYNSFGDKEALYMAVLNHYSTRQLHMKDEILALDTNSKQALKKFFEMLFLRNTENEGTYGCLLSNCSLELGQSISGISEILLRGKEIMTSNFADIIKLGQSKNEIATNIDPTDYATFIYNNLQGLRVLNGSQQDIKASKMIIEQLFERI